MNRVAIARELVRLAGMLVEEKPKKVTRATVKAILKKMKLKPDQYEMSGGDTVTFWPEMYSDDWHKGDRLAEKYAKQFAAILGGKKKRVTISSNGSKYWVRWKGEEIDMGDWNNPASRWHY